MDSAERNARSMLERVQHPDRFCPRCHKNIGVCKHTKHLAKYEDCLRYWPTGGIEGQQVDDAKTWLDEGLMIGLVDEEHGGIIGYFHYENIDRIVKALNREEASR